MLAAVACALAATVGAAPAGAVDILTESGTGATAQNPSWWSLFKSSYTGSYLAGTWPCLTAGTNTTQAGIPGCNNATPDSVGSGVIRIDALLGQGYQNGYVISSPLLPSAGLKVTFKTAEWGSGGAESHASFVLINGDVPVSVSSSAWLYGGYQKYTGGTTNGLPNALAGVMMDPTGAASATANESGCTGAPGTRNNALVLRGPGYTPAVGYCYIAGTAANTVTWYATTRAAATHTVEVDVSPTGDSNPRFIVKVDGTQQINVALSSLSPAGFTGATISNVSTYRFGFVSANGTGGVDDHAVWNIQADSLSTTPPSLSVAASGGALGLLAPASQTVVISNADSELAEATPVTVTSALPTGVVVQSAPSGTGWDCSATVVGSSSVSCTQSLTTATAVMPGSSLPALTVPLTLTSAAAPGATTITYNVTDQKFDTGIQ